MRLAYPIKLVDEYLKGFHGPFKYTVTEFASRNYGKFLSPQLRGYEHSQVSNCAPVGCKILKKYYLL
jgi:hypothetical protein